jgi:ATP-dependent protease ClpP protease subunit
MRRDIKRKVKLARTARSVRADATQARPRIKGFAKPSLRAPTEHPIKSDGGSFRAEVQGDALDLEIYDVIGATWDGAGVEARKVRDVLRGFKGSMINVRINSPGGDVFDGVAIYNDLVDHAARKVVAITGLAASAASVIAMAGDEIRMADSAFMMIHRAWALGIGNADDMTKLAKVLGKIDGALAGVYAARTGLDAADLLEMMSEETWLDAGDAIDAGFADGALADADVSASAKFDLSVFANAPAALRRKPAVAKASAAARAPVVDKELAAMLQKLAATMA